MGNNINKQKNNNHNNNNNKNKKTGNNKRFLDKLTNTMNKAILVDSIKKLSPKYLAKNNPVMFTVELGFYVVLFIAIFPNISETFVNQNQIFYIETAIILILTVWSEQRFSPFKFYSSMRKNNPIVFDEENERWGDIVIAILKKY